MRSRALLVLAGVLATSPARAQEAQEAPDTPAYEYLEEARVRAALEEVMARPEFGRLVARREEAEEEEPRWLSSVLDWLAELFDRGEASEPEAPVGGYGDWLLQILAFAAVVVALGGILIALGRRAASGSVAERPGSAKIERAPVAPGELTPEAYGSRAEAHAAAGRYKEAIRELLLGMMSLLERQGRIRHRSGLTNRDYLYAAAPALRAPLATIASAFEAVYFGRRPASAERFDACRLAYREAALGPGRLPEGSGG